MPTTKIIGRSARRRRIRARVRGTAARPRLCVYRSHTRISAQVVDDEAGRTVVAGSTAGSGSGTGKGKGTEKSTKKTKSTKSTTKTAKNMEAAKKLGTLIAEKAKAKKITSVVFDRSGYKYHGRIKALADAAREGGLQF